MNNVNGRLKALKAKFHPGTLVITPTLCRKVDPDYAMSALVQHLQGRWGVCDSEDVAANNYALENGGRLLSVYPLPNDPGVFWVLTEADRSVTTLLLPSDY
jgi:hypothetical protein